MLLIVGTLLPWVAGALCMLFLFRRQRVPSAGMLAVGAGFFFGYLALSFILQAQNALADSVTFWPATLVLSACALLAALGLRKLQIPTHPGGETEAVQNTTRTSTWVVLLLAAGITTHWAFSALEIISRPLFPWDGLAVWAYRAKAWFYDGALSPVVTQGAWLAAADPGIYTTPANGYPKLPSLAHLWAALSLGRWSESLINLPVLFCGTATALGLAGALRTMGTSLTGQLGGIYLLLSVPLFGAHMSLGGYGDIWMAGYAGLGMTLLLAGLIKAQKPLQGLGVALLMASLFVKPEGALWLLMGLLMLALNYLPKRVLIGALVAVPVIILIAVVAGFSSILIPGLGEMGYRDGMLLVGAKGSIPLELQTVSNAYWVNAFVFDSWHLVWILVLAACALLLLAEKPLRNTGLAFTGLFLLSQVLVFGMTSQGEFARSYTAINRLPLQMLPALIFLLVLAARPMAAAAHALLTKPPQALKVFSAALLSVVLVGGGIVLWTARDIGEQPQNSLALGGENLAFVIGGGSPVGDRVEIDQFQDGIAVLSSGQILIKAEDTPFLDPDLEFADDFISLDQAPAFFWRRADQAREVSRATLTDSGLLNLSDYGDWHGDIVEVGFFFVEGSSEPISLGTGSLSSESLSVALRSIPGQWLVFSGWTQRSLNFITGGGSKQRISLLQATILFVLLGSALAWVLTRRESALGVMFIMLALGWVLLDARWLAERSWQADLSLGQALNMSTEERLREGDDGKYFDFLARLKENDLVMENGRILVHLDPVEPDHHGIRAKYQLLPYASQMVRDLPPHDALDKLDYVIFLGDFTDGDRRAFASESRDQMFDRLEVESRKRVRLELISQNELGTLFRLHHKSDRKYRERKQRSKGKPD